MTIRKAKMRVNKRRRLRKIIEYILVWVLIIATVLSIYLPIQYAITKHCVKKQAEENKTHVTIFIGGEKLTLEDIDVVHIEEE